MSICKFGLALLLLVSASSSSMASGTGNNDFQRGDCNASGGQDIADAIFVLDHLFGGTTSIDCQDACDSNDDGSINIADAIFALANLFSGGANPPAPFSSCGPDPTADTLTCRQFAVCAPPALSLAADIQPIFNANCISCHSPGGIGFLATGLDLSNNTFAMLVGTASTQLPAMNRITAGDPNNSYLLHKVNGTQFSVGGAGSQMPLGGAPLPLATRNMIEQWILDGANP